METGGNSVLFYIFPYLTLLYHDFCYINNKNNKKNKKNKKNKIFIASPFLYRCFCHAKADSLAQSVYFLNISIRAGIFLFWMKNLY